MKLRILKWITYKGRRIPITERILRGARFLSKKEAIPIAEELDRRYWRRYGDIEPHFTKYDLKSLGISVRAVDEKFPGILHGTKIIPIKTSRGTSVLSFVVNDTLGRRDLQVLTIISKELRSATSRTELRKIAAKYGLGTSNPNLTYDTLTHLKNYYLTQIEKLKPLVILPLRGGRPQKSAITPDDIIICFQPSVLNKRDPLTQRHAWIHEFGHVLTAKLQPSQWKRWVDVYYPNQLKLRSEYGRTSPTEGFAEEFWLFISRGNNSTKELNEYFRGLHKEWNLL